VTDWDSLPRMLWELCDGCPKYMVEIYALDLPNGVRLWLCKSCWGDAWRAAGGPPQLNGRDGSPVAASSDLEEVVGTPVVAGTETRRDQERDEE
jgi:hypothetical protein